MKYLISILFALNLARAQELSIQDYLARPANPMKINVSLDNSKVSKKISALTGGTLSLTAANGDTYELTIPPKSLPSDLMITLQKVKSVKHPKLSTTANYSSVEISPDGTELLAPATLVFKPKHAFPIQTLTPFSAQADGNETHLAMLVGKQNPNEIKIGLLHFSNYTISDEPTVEEIIDQGFSTMESTRIANWFNRKILKSNRTNGDIAQDLDKSFRDTFDKVILPSILAVNTCASGSNALNNLLTWQRQIELVAGDPEGYYPPGFSVNLSQMFNDVSEQCFELAKKACYEDHQPEAVWKYALGFMRMGEFLSATDTIERFRNLAFKCSKFKFFMESEIWTGEERKNSSGVTAKAEFNFSLNPYTNEPAEGSIDVESTYLNIADMNCEQTSFETQPAKVLIENFLLPGKNENNFSINIGGLIPGSFAKFHCVDTSDPKNTVDMNVPPAEGGSYWGGLFMGTHGPTGLNEFDFKTGFYKMQKWQIRHDTKYAAKDYTMTVQDSLNEASTLIIYHTPDPL